MTTTPPVLERSGSDYAALSRRVAEAGLMDRRPGYYVLRFTLVGLGAAATATAFVLLGDSWWQLLVAAAAAFGTGQVALLAHDVAHRQVFRGRRASATVGRLLGNLGIGMSYGWWMDKHTRHHTNPNYDGLDPDVVPGVVIFSADQIGFTDRFSRFVQAHQRWLFFPLLTFEGIDLRRSSVQALLGKRIAERGLEIALLAVHVVGYLTAVFLVLPPGLGFAFIAVHQGLFGVYLGSIFAPNHKGMIMPDAPLDFLRKQVLTSRNVRGNRITDRPVHILMGGLNHQIEHHLFPSMPTANLPHARDLVRGYCAEVGVAYYETTLVRSWAEILQGLDDAGSHLRA